MTDSRTGTGLFISLEGIDGSGKSTQSRLLLANLERAGHKAVLTREPGGSKGAEDIRALLLSGDTDKWSAETEILLFSAARRDHLEKLIWPALDNGQTVITDRFADSTRVYQGATRGDLRGLVDNVHQTMIGVEPDLTLVFDMDPTVALERGLARNSGEDRFEDFGLPFQQTLRAGFKDLVADFPDRCVMIDASQSVNAIAKDVWAAVENRLDHA
ncbi:MAG: dTMP kinase [Planktomarina sp.]